MSTSLVRPGSGWADKMLNYPRQAVINQRRWSRFGGVRARGREGLVPSASLYI